MQKGYSGEATEVARAASGETLDERRFPFHELFLGVSGVHPVPTSPAWLPRAAQRDVETHNCRDEARKGQPLKLKIP